MQKLVVGTNIHIYKVAILLCIHTSVSGKRNSLFVIRYKFFTVAAWLELHVTAILNVT
jgi:hypothetical protein